jgi:hypothetical protein
MSRFGFSYQTYQKAYPRTLDYIDEVIEWKGMNVGRAVCLSDLSSKERAELAAKILLDKPAIPLAYKTSNLHVDLALFISTFSVFNAKTCHEQLIKHLIDNNSNLLNEMFIVSRQHYVEMVNDKMKRWG